MPLSTLFREQVLDGSYRLREEAPVAFSARRRVDPLTGLSVRLTGRRPLDSSAAGSETPDLSQRVQATTNCVFCEPRVWTETPRFAETLHQQGRFLRGESILFPNLMPYGCHSAVVLFSTTHHIPMGAFSHVQVQDALANSLDYLSRIRDVGRDDFAVISQNILPSSGGALLHPHMQVNADEYPMGFHQKILDREQAWQPAGRFLLDLEYATRKGVSRHLLEAGNWSFWMAFAPLGLGEVRWVHRSARSFAQLETEDVSNLALILTGLENYWASRGYNAANMAMFGARSKAHVLMGRFVLRATYRPWYRNDRSAYEVAMMESATDWSPEDTARDLRPALVRWRDEAYKGTAVKK